MPVSLSKSTELDLIRRAAAGDRLASGELIRAHQTSLYGYILRMCGRTDVAEDVVQEAFVRVLTNLDRFDPRFRFSTWLFTIGRRVFLNMLEKRRPSSDSDHVADACAARDVRPVSDDRQDQLIWRDSVQKALMSLGNEQREVVVLFHQHDWPIWLIAQHLAMPEGTVKSHLHRGRSKLREMLGTAAELPGSPANKAAANGPNWPLHESESPEADVVVRPDVPLSAASLSPRPGATSNTRSMENSRE
ncbi:MAG: RNA polymerase sigma factor [Phycisphaerales bacterium]|jgi:RNA polymerase sigma-70 factor (ECF subfamily)